MKRFLYILSILSLLSLPTMAEDAISGLLDRIGGKGCSKCILTEVEESSNGSRVSEFTISQKDGKPFVKGNSVLSVACGINWYLNHYAHINVSWSMLHFDHKAVSFPLPEKEERHVCRADYRYYLNYCTFSYSMAAWDWQRWQEEIDWMALHGINMPLQIVGLDVVWRNLLMKEYGYSKEEVNNFVAGPYYQAWWGMNNLEGYGGPNQDWWYERQEKLARQIVARERELGMQPVLPGYCGMVPSNFTQKTGIHSENQGLWSNFQRPNILSADTEDFQHMAAKYYKYLHELMGKSEYYSMDPFHESGRMAGIPDGDEFYDRVYKSIFDAMEKATKGLNGLSGSKWVIQQWQFSKNQYKVLDAVPKGRLVILDLKSDAVSYFGNYKNHDAVYCIIPNFGARTGISGRYNKVMRDYFKQCRDHQNVKGIGAAPEGIESVPVMYDMLYELPWLSEQPDSTQWLYNYVEARYGAKDSVLLHAWHLLQQSVYNCQDNTMQGPHEAIVCAKPSLHPDKVSTWGSAKLFYDQKLVEQAAELMRNEGLEMRNNPNFRYDYTDVIRQSLTDEAMQMLYDGKYDDFMKQIQKIDSLLSKEPIFTLKHWIESARNVAPTEEGKEWMEHYARELITTWAYPGHSPYLFDYSYREWAGMLRDYYYPRWKQFFKLNNK